MGAQDIEVTARILNDSQYPDQMKHVFGLGNLPPYVAGIDDPQRDWFNWYWGENQGIYSAGTGRHRSTCSTGRQPRGPEAHAGDRSSRACSACRRAVARRATRSQSFMIGLRAHARPALRRVLAGGARLRHHVVEPDRGRQGQDPLRRRHRPVHVHRRREALPTPGSGRRASRSSSTRATRSPQFDALPESDVVPTYPCTGCPSAAS